MSTPYVGEIRMFGFSRVPAGWLPCNGQPLSIAENEVLYTLIGTTYGGDGINTFAVPDLRGQVPLHQGTGSGLSPHPIGQNGGTESVTLIASQMPQHGHSLVATTVAATSTSLPANGELARLVDDTMYVTDASGLTPLLSSTGSTSATGNNNPHENTMPTLTVQFCIASEGVFPSQG